MTENEANAHAAMPLLWYGSVYRGYSNAVRYIALWPPLVVPFAVCKKFWGVGRSRLSVTGSREPRLDKLRCGLRPFLFSDNSVIKQPVQERFLVAFIGVAMIKLKCVDLKTFVKKEGLGSKIKRADRAILENFKSFIEILLAKLPETQNERQVERCLEKFFDISLKSDEIIPQENKKDLSIKSLKLGCTRGIIEVKSTTNKSEFISVLHANRKSLWELLLYFYREVKSGNNCIKYLYATNGYEWFVFDARIFYNKFVKECPLYAEFKKDFDFAVYDNGNDAFYKKAKDFLEKCDDEIEGLKIDLREKKTDSTWQNLYKFFNRRNLLDDEVSVEHDVNEINQKFFYELLYIMGLHEIDKNGKRVIEFIKTPTRTTLCELAIRSLEDIPIPMEKGESSLERQQNVALELCITWINRLLFIKLLEGKITSYKKENEKFLTYDKIKTFKDLHNLFVKILGTTYEKRDLALVEKFSQVPYLNSSLFELSRSELEFIKIYALDTSGSEKLPFCKNTVFKDMQKKGVSFSPIEYLLNFLDRYDFVGDSSDKALVVNAAVLGKVFEKINGYKDGSFYTPSFVTMFICRNTIDKTIIAMFNEKYGWKCKSLTDLYNQMERDSESIKKYNEVVNSTTIADISVGSGHFLVSALNEVLWLKANLGILVDAHGRGFKEYTFEIENDELVVRCAGEKVKYDYRNAESQRLQETLFNEKKTILSNCLFGVDINPNSVNICCLRLWIELLKNTYYKPETGYKELEILPNIDINIKCGNSLINKLPIIIGKPKQGANVSVEETIKKKVRTYKKAVIDYKQARDKNAKKDLKTLISQIKRSFKKDESTIWMAIDKEAIRQNEENERNGLFSQSMEWMIEFPELMDENGYFVGFDCIVGNPPYMRVQEIEKTQPKEKLYYETQFPNSTGTGAYDLAFIFVEQALRLMKDGNICSYIMPHKFLNADGAECFRNWLKQDTIVKRMAHFGANQVFKGASTYTCITEFSKSPTDGIQLYKASFKSDYVNEMLVQSNYNKITYASIEKAALLYGKNQWIMFTKEAEFSLFEHIYRTARKIENMFNVFVGLQTSKDDLYVLNRNADGSFTVPETGATYNLEKEFFKPMLKGENVHRYKPLRTNRYVFFPYKKPSYEPVGLDELKQYYPLTYRYVMDNEKLFKARESGKAAKMPVWYEYIYPKNKDKFEQEKLSSMELCSNCPNVTLNSEKLYHNTKVYSWVKKENVDESYKYLLAILNSKLIWWFLKLTGDTLSTDTRTFKTEYLNPFPMPDSPTPSVMRKVEETVELMMKLVAEKEDDSNIQALEKKLNLMVYKLYNLSLEEAHVIEPNLECTEAEYANLFA